MANSIKNIGGIRAGIPIDPVGMATPLGGGGPGTGQRGTEVTAPDSSTTSLSPLGDVLSAMARGAISLNSFRADLVTTIKSGISAGTYQPDPMAVAGRVALALGSFK